MWPFKSKKVSDVLLHEGAKGKDNGKIADIYFIRLCLIERDTQSGRYHEGIPIMDEPQDKDKFVLAAITNHGYTLSERSKVDFKVIPLPPNKNDVFLSDIDYTVDNERCEWFEISALCVGKQTRKILLAQGILGSLYIQP